MEELLELPPFLSHENPKVRLQAATIIMGFSQSREHRLFFRTMKPPLLPRLRSQLTDDDAEVAECVLKTMINLAEDAALRGMMIKGGTIDIGVQLLKKKHKNNNLHVMLLQNLTIELVGAEKFSQEGSALEGLNTRLLLQWMNDPERETLTGLANILTNVTQCTSVRKLMADPRRDILGLLKDQLRSRFPPRRFGVLHAIKNVFRDPSFHAQLLKEETGLMAEILLLIVGPETMDDDETAFFLSEVLCEMGPDKKRDPDVMLRRCVLDIIDLCCSNKPS